MWCVQDAIGSTCAQTALATWASCSRSRKWTKVDPKERGSIFRKERNLIFQTINFQGDILVFGRGGYCTFFWKGKKSQEGSEITQEKHNFQISKSTTISDYPVQYEQGLTFGSPDWHGRHCPHCPHYPVQAAYLEIWSGYSPKEPTEPGKVSAQKIANHRNQLYQVIWCPFPVILSSFRSCLASQQSSCCWRQGRACGQWRTGPPCWAPQHEVTQISPVIGINSCFVSLQIFSNARKVIFKCLKSTVEYVDSLQTPRTQKRRNLALDLGDDTCGTALQ